MTKVGTREDITQAVELLSGYRSEYAIADKGYDAQSFIGGLTEDGVVAVIPPRTNRKELRNMMRTYTKNATW